MVTTELLLAPAGAGKTHAALRRLIAQQQAKVFARIWVLLASSRQEDAFRQRLLDLGGGSIYFNIEFFGFYDLYAHLLNLAQEPPRRLHDVAQRDTGRYSLLRALAEQLRLRGELAVYAPIAHTNGFIKIVADFIYELKQNLITPEEFSLIASSDKDDDLAQLYSAYQEKLIQKNVVDQPGEGWLAQATVADEPYLGQDVDLLIVDGFDQFTPLQAAIVALLAGRARQTLVTLTAFPLLAGGRPDDRRGTVGRRFVQALDELQRAGLRAEQHWLTPAPEGSARHSSLQQLADRLFRLDVAVSADAAPGTLSLLEAPTPESEAALVLRRVKRLLLDTGTQPDDVLVVLRDWQRYGAPLMRYGDEYRLPLALHYGEPLAENPLMIALLNLLELPASGFARVPLLETLRSPYFAVPGLQSEHLDLLERLSRRLLVTEGLKAWREALATAPQTPLSEWDDPDAVLDGDAEPLLDGALAGHIDEHLMNFFEAITPPEVNTVGEYVHWIEGLIGPDTGGTAGAGGDPDDDSPQIGAAGYSLHVARCLRQPAGKAGVAERDAAAMQEFKRVLRSLLSARDLLRTLDEDDQLNWETFYSDLKAAVEHASIDARPPRTGRVLVTTAADARGLAHRHVFVLGLSEGIFPAPTPQDPLYLDSERRVLADALRQYGKMLRTRAEQAADDGLFYELVSLAHDSLVLSRPYVQDGAPLPPSHLWRAVQAVYPAQAVERLPVGSVVSPADVASRGEAAVAVARGLNVPPAQLTPETRRLHDWLAARSAAFWVHVLHGRSIERRRMSRSAAFDPYSGLLLHPALVARVAALLGAERRWSASQLSDYGKCPFRFFARYLLRLEALQEPEAGMDALQLGSLNHKILENTYRRIRTEKLAIVPQNADAADAILRETAQEVFASAPQEFGFREGGLWQQEQAVLLRRLAALVQQDFKDSPVDKDFGGAPRLPYLLEQRFGAGDGSDTLELGDGLRIRVRGVIDRVDLQGDRAIIIDYKTGSTSIDLKEMQEGRNFQMMVYLLAADQLLRQPVAGGLFWHIGTRKTSGVTRRGDGEHEAALDTARQQIADNIAAGRAGDFSVQPNTPRGRGPCATYCEYQQFCRHSITGKKR